MALKIVIQHRTGAYSEYWNMRKLDVDRTKRTIVIELDGFYSHQARLDGFEPLDKRTFICKDPEYGQFFEVPLLSQAGINPILQAYMFLKRPMPDPATGVETNAWASAEDV